MRQAISNYIDKNGIGNIVTRQELSAMVSAIMPVESNSFLPADYCYNRTNKGISFESHIHLFELMDDGRYEEIRQLMEMYGRFLDEKKMDQDMKLRVYGPKVSTKKVLLIFTLD